jgi:sigma-E factor negative regulatory protein RseB
MTLVNPLFLALVLWAGGGLQTTAAQSTTSSSSVMALKDGHPGADRSTVEWLMRLHEAPRKRTYTGTLVVSNDAGAMSSARIWHVCDGEQQMERVETLTGPPRSTFRHDDDVVVFSSDSRVARVEKRESLGPFPNFLKASESAISEFYSVRQIGRERVAGVDADIVHFVPRDKLRFGYRIWSEKNTGLAVKLQTLDPAGRVLEQAAFSELQLDVPVKMEKLAQLMGRTDGYRLEKSEMVKTTAAAEGWSLGNAVPGFRPVNCFKRPASERSLRGEGTVQWVFSDGLATVSLFVESFDRQRHLQEGALAMGATQTLTRRLGSKGDGDWWLTAVGEVPIQTLQAFAQGLERRR